MNTVPLFLAEIQGFLQVPGHAFLSSDPYIILFYVLFCFEAPYVICIIDSFAWNSQPIIPQVLPG